MLSRYDGPPPNKRSLDARLRNQAQTEDPTARQTVEHRLRLTMAAVIVGQMLDPGAVKGGAGLALRHGYTTTRFTRDLDVVTPTVDTDEYLDDLAERLAQGWSGFTGRIKRDQPATPANVPPQYVMLPSRVQLDYLGQHWFSITLELSADEVGSTTTTPTVLADDISDLFEQIGLPRPNAVAAIPIEHQIVQKIHACSDHTNGTGNDRAHDLVDLQLLCEYKPDLAVTRAIALRLFAFRKRQPWPPTITANDRWPTLYNEAATGLDILEDAHLATNWANDLIRRIDEAQ